jgi:hypothetical protein
MKRRPTAALPAVPFLAILAVAGPAAAEGTASGRWLVAGHVADKDFTLDCTFQQAGAGLTGVCVDGDTHDARVKGGRAHPLIKGEAVGERIAFTYESSYGLLHFKVDYAGTRDGDHMRGAINTLGKTGTFTGERKAP